MQQQRWIRDSVPHMGIRTLGAQTVQLRHCYQMANHHHLRTVRYGMATYRSCPGLVIHLHPNTSLLVKKAV